MSECKVLAYYLPQFHPFKENDEWWGKGFTEWVNVAKARPFYKGHYQPKIPADLGFYDLRLPETRRLQAEYAKQAGISAFCYWHYWFGNGFQLMQYPLEEVVRLGEPDFPFCLAWANHTWYKKTWTGGNNVFSLTKSAVLAEQTYPGKEDYRLHFETMLPAFRDKRYFRLHGKLVFVVYAPQDLPNPQEFMDYWQELAHKEGLPGFYFIAHCYLGYLLPQIRKLGFDAINFSMHHDIYSIAQTFKNSPLRKVVNGLQKRFHVRPNVMQYAKAIEKMDTPLWEEEKIYPTILPNWDHTPRSGRFGRVFQDCTPDLFGKHVQMTLERIKHKPMEDKVVFIKSWNEWGEGNYMEPDMKYGTGYIEALRGKLDHHNIKG